MLPHPLHPAVVHFPIVLMLLLPVAAFVALWMIRRGANVRRAWAVPVLGAAALAGSSWMAVSTGGQESERVERVVSEQPVETHEESAELFFALSGVLLVVAGAGMIRGVVGRTARGVATVGAIAVAVAGVQVGHTGGQLVYRHGAAAAYSDPTLARGILKPGTRESGGEVRER
ncbi:MAG TPA: DUF2231 domain-containing protein [Gemmatimonadaceae bacterium]